MHLSLLLLMTCAYGVAAITPHPLSDEFIAMINKRQNLWTAGRNFPSDTSLAHFEKLTGTLPDEHLNNLEVMIHEDKTLASLPKHYNSHQHFPNCSSIYEIRDQGACGSCWAFGAVEAMTDRICIASNGTKHAHLSAEDLLSCCPSCGNGCKGGHPSLAWTYWKCFGIVTGGNYGSRNGCRPYEEPPHELLVSGNRLRNTPQLRKLQCVKKCVKGYKGGYDTDKHYGKRIYSLPRDELQIRAEIYKNGPVEASFTVYSDFFWYKKGVYVHVLGKRVGRHSVKILGWGVKNGVNYWMVANSWGSSWGEGGFFKIYRGDDHCGIENAVVAGEPLLGY